MFNLFHKDDTQLKDDVLTELRWDPSVSSDGIIVSAEGGVVTLRGSVPHYLEKSYAERAAERVKGTRAVVDELKVDILDSFARADIDIAKAAINSLDWNYQVPAGIQVAVENGWVTLNGEVEWDYERNAARNAVASLMGVNGVSNNITIKGKHADAKDLKERIEAALKRSAESEGKNIMVTVNGSEVTLSGNVHSISELQDARMAAWNAAGVSMVSDDLKIAA
jgi:osmotically-inducible protein OsmY